MSNRISRRDFMRTSAAAGLAAAAPQTMFGKAPTMLVPPAVKPLVIASGNGNRSKNSENETCVEKAYSMIAGGEDVMLESFPGF